MPLNDIHQDQQLGFYSSEFFTIDYKNSAGTYVPIPGVQDISFDGATAPPRDVISANTAAQQRMGISRVGQVTVNATAMPQDPAWRAMRDAQYDQTLMHFRVRMNAVIFFDGNNDGNGTKAAKVSINTSGVVSWAAGGTGGDEIPTIAGTPLGRGQLIRPKTISSGSASLGDKGYLITEIRAEDASSNPNQITAVDMSTYKAPTTAVTSSPFTLYSPAPLQRVFSAMISQGADTSVSAESEMTTTLVLAPMVRLPDWAVYLP